MTGARRNRLIGNLTRKGVLAIGAATALASLASQAFATTYTWTRAGGTNNWNLATNWGNSTVPPATPAGGDTTDLHFFGNPGNTTSTQNTGSLDVNSITFAADTVNAFALSTSSSPAGGNNLNMYGGGISYLGAATMNINAGSAINPTINLMADQTWHSDGTLSVKRIINGAFKITKTGTGSLIFSQFANPTWTGGLEIVSGFVRLQDFSNCMGTGTLTHNSASAGTLTASGTAVVNQTIAGEVNLGGTGTFALGGSYDFTFQSQVNLLSDKTFHGSRPATFQGPIVGAFAFRKTGGGTLLLTSTSSTNTSFEAGGGYIPLDDEAKLGAPGGTLTLSGGTLLTTAPLVITRPVQLGAAITNIGRVDTNGFDSTINDVLDGVGDFAKEGAGVLTAGGVRSDGTLSVNAGKLVIAPNGTDASTVHAGTLAILGGPGAPTTTLDLNDNDMVVTVTSTTDIQSLVSFARNGGGWDQPGVTSTAAKNQASQATTLGVMAGAEYTAMYGAGAIFDGFTVADTDTLVKYTWYGDADYNGSVDFDDYVRTDGGYNGALTGWSNGDFDGNGSVDFDDYVLIDLGFNAQTGTLRRAMSFIDGSDRSLDGMDAPALQKMLEHFAQFGTDYGTHFLSAVPEPATSSMLVIGTMSALGVLRRRRRQD